MIVISVQPPRARGTLDGVWCRALLVLVAIAAPAHARKVVPLPELDDGRPGRSRNVIVVAPSTPVRVQPAPLAPAAIAKLERRARTATGRARVAALDALLAAREGLDVPDDEIVQALRDVAGTAARLLAEPALDRYPHAAEVLVRCAKTVGNETLAREALERVLANHASSRFAIEARLLLANIADRDRRYAQAKSLLEAVIANPAATAAFVDHARLRLGWIRARLGDHAGAVADLVALATDPRAALLHEPAVETMLEAYARVGRAEHAGALFDRVDTGKSAGWLRELADEYSRIDKHADAVTALRAAFAREVDPTQMCFDRADIVTALTTTPNRADAEHAIAELGALVPTGGAPCAAAADVAVGALAYAWHVGLERRDDRRRLVRVWNRAIELATTPDRKTAATRNRDAIRARR